MMFPQIKQLFAILRPKEKINLFFIFVLQVVVAGMEMAGMASIMPFMAVVVNPNVIQSNSTLNHIYTLLHFDNERHFLLFLGVVVLFLLVVSNVAKALSAYVTLRYDNGLYYNLARRLLASYLAKPYEFYLDRNTAEMGKNVLSEVRNVITGVLSAGIKVVSGALISTFIIALLLVVDVKIALTIIFVLGGCYGIIFLIVRKRLMRIGQEQVEANAEKFKLAGEVLAGVKDLKVLGRELSFLTKFSIPALRHAKNNVYAGIIAALPRYLLEMMAFGGVLVMVLVFLSEDVGAGRMVPLLALYAFAGYRMIPALQQIFASAATLRFHLNALKVVHDDLIKAPGDTEPEELLVAYDQAKPLPVTREIAFEDVSFRYFGAKEDAVHSLSFTIGVNTTIGFVGSTGSGKTTTVDLMLGLLRPRKGRIVVDGQPVTGEKVARWQRSIGYVPQSIFLSDETIAANIAFGVSPDAVEMAAVKRAARVANLSEFIENECPNGYLTEIGERGVRLSGGQRQRIGIARALYNDPPVLILDEATSSLDGLTEDAVMDAIQHLLGQKTIIMIAHRLTTVKNCDRIFLLDHGRIVNQGTFTELQESSEWFRASAGIGV